MPSPHRKKKEKKEGNKKTVVRHYGTMLGSNDTEVRNSLWLQETQSNGENKIKQMTIMQCYIAIHRLLNKHDRERVLRLLSIKWKNFPSKGFSMLFFPEYS